MTTTDKLATEKPTPHPIAAMFINDVLAVSPIARTLGIVVDTADVDRIMLSLPYKPDLVTVADTVHGGVIATLIDTAGAMASASGITDENTVGGATSALNINYISPANAVDLTATAVVAHRTRRQTITDVTVAGADGELVAKATVTSRIFLKS